MSPSGSAQSRRRDALQQQQQAQSDEADKLSSALADDARRAAEKEDLPQAVAEATSDQPAAAAAGTAATGAGPLDVTSPLDLSNFVRPRLPGVKALFITLTLPQTDRQVDKLLNDLEGRFDTMSNDMLVRRELA